MTKIDIYSGFLGAGKTTLIKKLIAEAYKGEKLVLIENEFGDIGIDGGFLQDAGVNITEMNSGCICCSLVGDFSKALKQVVADYAPERILIEPSGVGKLSDVISAVQNAHLEDAVLNSFTAVVDVNKCKMYMKNFGEFFNNQIECANTIILSHTTGASDKKLADCVAEIRAHNATADILTTPWEQLDGARILELMEKKNTLEDELAALLEETKCPVCGGHHHHHDHDEHEHEHDEHCGCHHHHDEDEHEHEHGEHCGCHHDHDDDEHEHEHGEHCSCHHDHDDEHEHEHEHDEHCGCHHDHDNDEHEHEHGEHCGCHHDHDDDEHEHEHDEHCGCHHNHDDDEHEHEHNEHCGCHHDHDEHEHHHHHHADEVFTSFGAETVKAYTADEIRAALSELVNEQKYGVILRAKGIVRGTDGFIHFDYVPGEPDVRTGSAAPTGRLCVIGSKLNEPALKELFGL